MQLTDKESLYKKSNQFVMVAIIIMNVHALVVL